MTNLNYKHSVHNLTILQNLQQIKSNPQHNWKCSVSKTHIHFWCVCVCVWLCSCLSLLLTEEHTLPQDPDFLATAATKHLAQVQHPSFSPSSSLSLLQWKMAVLPVCCPLPRHRGRAARASISSPLSSNSTLQQASLISSLPHKLPHTNLIYRWMKLRKEGGEQEERGEQQSWELLLIFTELARWHGVDIPQTLQQGLFFYFYNISLILSVCVQFQYNFRNYISPDNMTKRMQYLLCR